MGKFADAIRERRRSRPRRLGFGAASEAPQPSMLVGVLGVVEGADFNLAVSEAGWEAAASAGVLWGTRVDALTAESVAAAKDKGAAFVSFKVADAQAAGLLDEAMDYVVRLDSLRIDEADARALASLRAAELAAPLEFPISLQTVLELRRLALLTSTPLGAVCPADVSSGDLEALRDSGVAVLVLDEGASPEDVASLKERIAELPERKPQRDDTASPLLPASTASAPSEEFEEEE